MILKNFFKGEAKWFLLFAFSILCWLTYFFSSFFVIFFFVPILFTINKVSLKARWSLLFFQFIIFNLIASYWLINVDFKIGILVHSLNALGMFITTFLSVKISRILKINTSISFISFWLLYEQLHQLWSFTWPWLSLGNITTTSPIFYQYYNLFGSLSGTLVILMLNYTVYVLIFQDKTLRNRITIASVSLVSAIVFYGILSSYFNKNNPIASINIKAIVPNKIYTHSRFEDSQFFDSSISKDRWANKNALIIMPENVLMDNIWSGFLGDSKIINSMKQYSKIEKCAGFLFGTEINSDRTTDYGLKNHLDKDYHIIYSKFGASIFVDSFKQLQIHLKRKLVPKVEFLPKWLEDYVTQSGKLSHGRDFNNFRLGDAKLVNLICYESFFGEDVARCVKDSGQAIIMIANQQMFPYRYADEFYTNVCKIRAIENNRYFVKVSNKGQSCLIDPSGKIISKGDDKRFSTLITKLPLLSSQTFYTRNANWLHWFYLLQPLLLLIYRLVCFLIKRLNFY